MSHKPTEQESQEMGKAAQALLDKMAAENKTLQEVSGISDKLLEEIYSLAYAHYNLGKYKESLSLFQFLAGIAPKQPRFVLGLAATYHQMENYSEAAMGFFLAYNLDPQNPLPAYYAADCYLNLKTPEAAIDCLELAIHTAGENKEFEELKQRCLLTLNTLKCK